MEETNGSGTALTIRDLVLEVRDDVKELKTNAVSKVDVALMNQRINNLEDSRLILRGAWLTVGVLFSTFMGLAGLVLAVLSHL